MADIISEILQHVYLGDYNQAKQTIDNELLKNTEREIDIALSNIICKILIKKGDYKAAVELAEKSIEKAIEISDPVLEFTVYIIKIEALIKDYNLKTSFDCLTYLEKLLKVVQETEPNYYNEALGSIYFLKGYQYRFSHDLQKGLEYYAKSIELRRLHQEKYGLAESLNHLGITHWMLGNFVKSLECYNESYEIFNRIGDKITSIGVTMNIGLVYRETGNYSEALTIYNEGLQLSKNLNNKRLMAGLFMNIGLVNIDLGNQYLAEETTLNAVEIFLELDDRKNVAVGYVNLGIIYDFKWLFDKSLEFYDKSIGISEKIDNNYVLALAYHNKSLVLRKLKKYELALINSTKAIQISEKLENSSDLIKYYYELILTYIALNDLKSAQLYLNKLGSFEDNIGTDWINFIYKLASSFVLKASFRVINQAEAQKILTEIIKYENIPHEYEYEALQSLVEILINEAKLESNEEINSEIQLLISRIHKLSIEKNSFVIKINALILESQTAFIMGDTRKSVESLETAKIIANDEGVPYLVTKIESVETFHKMRIREMQKQVEKGKIYYKTEDSEISDYINFINEELSELQIKSGSK